jgi:uroporphyrin-III C-methyltransferase
MTQPPPETRTLGAVTLVGAGPGDPGLLTLAGQEAISQAEVLVYDRLVNAKILDHAPASALRIHVGKTSGYHPIPQDEINAILFEHAQAGRRVCRVKGGDPFVFGRGSEELDFLRSRGIPCRVIPGVSSTTAVPALADIPLTDRRHAASFAVITGHKAGPDATGLDWAGIAQGADTLVFVMGLTNLPEITAGLTKHGRPASTPIAIIQEGTLPTQRVLTGTLDSICDKALRAGIRPPALIVVGEVVSLRQEPQPFGAA